MKKVINGRMYDTETARMIGKVTLGEPRSWDYHEEVLFKKRSGEYFFRLEGTTFSRCLEHIYIGIINASAERIQPTSKHIAKLWAEENLDGDTYIELFGKTEDVAEAENILSELKFTYLHLRECDMDVNNEGDRRHLRAVRKAIEFIEETVKEMKGE